MANDFIQIQKLEPSGSGQPADTSAGENLLPDSGGLAETDSALDDNDTKSAIMPNDNTGEVFSSCVESVNIRKNEVVFSRNHHKLSFTISNVVLAFIQESNNAQCLKSTSVDECVHCEPLSSVLMADTDWEIIAADSHDAIIAHNLNVNANTEPACISASSECFEQVSGVMNEQVLNCAFYFNF